VWEWRSETYVLKQQGHFFDVNVLAYSPDGRLIATGGDDGKVKIWNTSSGFCFVTFANHSAPVTAVEFSLTGTVVFSSSLDGTVRAYDLTRYRPFRLLTSPTPTQFSCLAIDPSGELVCAGSVEPFDVYVWSLKTGKLLDVLSGHTGPLSSLSFSSAQSLLASASWDGSVRTWDVFNGTGVVETYTHATDVLAVAFRPDGKEIASSSLDGQIYFWDVHEGTCKGVIEGRKDIIGGRRQGDARTAMNSTHGSAFTSLCYSADGQCVLAGGNSKYVCIYAIDAKLLLKKFQWSRNESLSGMKNFLNSRHIGENGDVNAIDDTDDDSDLEQRQDKSLPGASKADLSSRKKQVGAITLGAVNHSHFTLYSFASVPYLARSVQSRSVLSIITCCSLFTPSFVRCLTT
jgi:periodic tryptophan protein 2